MLRWRLPGFGPLLALTAFAMAGVVAIGALALQASYDQSVAQARQLTTNLAAIAERNVERDFGIALHAVDDVLTALSLPGFRRADPALQDAALFSTMPDDKEFGPILVISPSGAVTAISGGRALPAANFADRDYFEHHRTTASSSAFVGSPVMGRLEGGHLITVSRRIPAPDGSFGGVVAASIRLSSFHQLFDRLDLGRQGVVSLMSQGGSTLARAPELPSGFVLPASVRQSFLEATGSPSSFRRADGPDGIERFYALQRVEGLPLVVLAGVSVQEVLGPWQRRVQLTAGLGAVLGGVELLLLLALQRQFRRRRAAENELRQLNHGLEARVSREIAARQTTHDRMVAGQRLEALGQLAGGVAHDFNNVLQVIASASDLLAQQAGANQNGLEATGAGSTGADGRRHLLNLIAKATCRGASVTHRLLSFARQSELRVEAADLVLLVKGSSELLAHTLGGGVQVEVSCQEAHVPVLVDAAQFETVLINLVANARDAMTSAGGVVTVTVGQVQATASHAGLAFVAVSDTGCGMAPAVLARAAEPFFTTKPVGQGTGLGLAMACGFAEQSGGRLDIASQVGLGTKVTLYLPQKAAPDLSGTTDLGTQLMVASPQPSAPPCGRVLLVDDDDLVRELLAEAMVQFGYGVVQASDAAAALRSLGTDPCGFDALVTDLSMPGMTGLELITAARRGFPDLPAVLVTGYAGDEVSQAHGGAAGGEYVLLHKPLRASQLVEVIAKVTTDRTATRSTNDRQVFSVQ